MPEFNALYQLLNVKTKTLYSEKFSIHVIDLSRIDLATEEDLHYGIDRWAKLFKTKTWEDLRMITKIMKQCKMLRTPYISSTQTQ